LLLARALDRANPGDRILVASLADGCDAAVFEVTSRIAQGRPKHSVDAWIASKRNDLAYNTYLKWRGILPFEPPRSPAPVRPAAPPMHRGAGPPRGTADAPQRAMEARLRRLALHRLRRGSAPAAARVQRV